MSKKKKKNIDREKSDLEKLRKKIRSKDKELKSYRQQIAELNEDIKARESALEWFKIEVEKLKDENNIIKDKLEKKDFDKLCNVIIEIKAFLIADHFNIEEENDVIKDQYVIRIRKKIKNENK